MRKFQNLKTKPQRDCDQPATFGSIYVGNENEVILHFQSLPR